VSHDCRVAPGSGADMHDMLARLRAGLGDQLGVQRRLAVVEMPLGQDPDHTVEIKEGGVGARCRVIVAERSDDQPRSWAKEIFAAQLGKGGLDPGVGDTRRGHHLSRIGAPHKAEFLFPIHSEASAIGNCAPKCALAAVHRTLPGRKFLCPMLSRSAPEARIWNSTRC